MSDTLQQKQTAANPQPAEEKPNDTGAFSVQAHFKIFDPKTSQTYVEGRG
jgi:hypothetical protein